MYRNLPPFKFRAGEDWGITNGQVKYLMNKFMDIWVIF